MGRQTFAKGVQDPFSLPYVRQFHTSDLGMQMNHGSFPLKHQGNGLDTVPIQIKWHIIFLALDSIGAKFNPTACAPSDHESQEQGKSKQPTNPSQLLLRGELIKEHNDTEDRQCE